MQVDLTGLGKELYCGGETDETLARRIKYMSQQVYLISFLYLALFFWHTLTEIKLFICQGLGVQI